MSIDRGMDKEDVVQIYNGILLSHKTERSWVICRDVDRSRDCHTEWSKSEREKQISYINTYMWNLEKWYRWTGLQDRNWDTDVENKRTDTKGGKRRLVGMVVWWIGRLGLICIHWCVWNGWLIKKNNNKQGMIFCNHCPFESLNSFPGESLLGMYLAYKSIYIYYRDM